MRRVCGPAHEFSTRGPRRADERSEFSLVRHTLALASAGQTHMRRHTITAAILMVLAPLSAAIPGTARAAGMRSGAVRTDESLPSISDEVQGAQPVYTPGDMVGQYGPGP